jgi:hypothetical protein
MLLITESLSQQGSIQGESDTEPDGLIQSMTNKLGGIFSDSDSSQDADISENDDNGDLADASLEKPVFITSKGPVHIALGNSVLWESFLFHYIMFSLFFNFFLQIDVVDFLPVVNLFVGKVIFCFLLLILYLIVLY